MGGAGAAFWWRESRSRSLMGGAEAGFCSRDLEQGSGGRGELKDSSDW